MNLKNLARLYQEVDDMLYYALPFENHPSVDAAVEEYVSLGCDNEVFATALVNMYLEEASLDDELKIFKQIFCAKSDLLNDEEFKDYIVGNYSTRRIYEIFTNSEIIEGDDDTFFYLDSDEEVASISIGGIEEELEDHNRILVRKYAEGITKVVNALAPVADEMGFFKELYK